MKGVVAAGHPLTAEAGAGVLREGGNAVDAAVCAVLASFAVESPLTGFGAGGFMMVHRGEETALIDFFVAAPGRDGIERRAELVPVRSTSTPRRCRRSTSARPPAACPAPPPGWRRRCERFGSVPLGDLVGPGIRLAREGAPVNAEQAYILEILAPIHDRPPGTRELYAPRGRPLREGDIFRFPELAEALERFAAEGAEPFYRGEVAAALSDFVVEHGGTLGPGDLAAYEAVERKPIRAPFRGAEVLTNPPPSSGGILIAYCLGLLERLGESSGPEQLVAAMGAANDAAARSSPRRSTTEGMESGFLDPVGLDPAAADLLGSTTHISVLDGDGMCASVTCSNGSGSGVLVPGTGVILNNMLGEEDLNPLGFHRIAAGPPGALDDGADRGPARRRDRARASAAPAPTGSARRSCRRWSGRSSRGCRSRRAVEAPRLHFEQGIVQAEPGIDEAALARLEARGIPVARRPRDQPLLRRRPGRRPRSPQRRLSGGGDPRRGGAVAYA